MVDFPTRLYHAVDDDDCQELVRLIENGADVNQVFDGYSHRKTILHFACGKGRIKCVEKLVENGASVNARDKWRMPPLMYCIGTEHFEIAQLLILKDPKTIDAQDMHGRTALHIAVEYCSEKAVSMLLKMGADVNMQNFNGYTPLMSLMTSKDSSSYIILMNILITAGADVNIQSFRDKRTALHFAVISKKVKAVEELLKLKANPNHIDTAGQSPLTSLLSYNVSKHRSTSEMNDDVMTIAVLLTHAGTFMNISRSENGNPLLMAASARCHQLVRLFLENGADVNVTDPFSGVTPLLIAVKQNNIDTVKVLLNWNCRLNVIGQCYEDCSVDPFDITIREGLWDIMEVLILHGYNVSKVSYLQGMYNDADVPSSLIENDGMLQYLRKCASSPTTLAQICIWAIFKGIGCDIGNRLEYLPLPGTLKRQLKCQYFKRSKTW